MHPQSSAQQPGFPFRWMQGLAPMRIAKVLTENTDLLDRLVDVPMTKQECGQVLGYYMQYVANASPAIETESYANARRELSALLQYDLDPFYFRGAAMAGEQIECRRTGYPLADGYEMWTDEQLTIELEWCIDCMIEGIER